MGDFFNAAFSFGEALVTAQTKLEGMHFPPVAICCRAKVKHFLDDFIAFAACVPSCDSRHIFDFEVTGMSDEQTLGAVDRSRLASGLAKRLKKALSENRISMVKDVLGLFFGSKSMTMDELKRLTDVVVDVGHACDQFYHEIMAPDIVVDEKMAPLIADAAIVEKRFIVALDMVISQIPDEEFFKEWKDFRDGLIAQYNKMCGGAVDFLDQFQKEYPGLYGDFKMSSTHMHCKISAKCYNQ